MDKIRAKKGFICDMDGVIYHGNRILPGVVEFVNWLYETEKEFLFLTNNSGKTPRQFSHEKLAWMGLQVDESHFYTSAQATADFHRPADAGSPCVCHRRTRAVQRPV